MLSAVLVLLHQLRPTHPPHRLPTTCDGQSCLSWAHWRSIVSTRDTHTGTNYGSDSLSKNRPGALTQVSGWSPFVSRRPEVISDLIPPTVPALIDDGRVRRLPQGFCTPPFTHVPGGVGNVAWKH